MALRVAFIKTGSFSSINQSILEHLKKEAPEWEFLEIDAIKLYPKVRKLSIGKLWACFRHFGWKGIRSFAAYKVSIMSTGYHFDLLSKYVRVELKAINPDIILQTQGLFNARIDGLPYFIYTDGTCKAEESMPGFIGKKLKSKPWLKLEKQMWQDATKIFTMSDHISESLQHQYYISQGRITNVGAGPNIQISKRENRLGARKHQILWVGLDWERKGGPQLLEIFRLIKNEIQDATLIVAGCKPGVSQNGVEFIGKIPLAELTTYFETSELFLFPTRLEPFGIVYIEALSYGLPVIASNFGAAKFFIKNDFNGHLVDADNIVGFADSAIHLLKNRVKLQHMKENAEMSAKDYTWQNTSRIIINEVKASIN